jgi:hypothetical protein
MRPDTNHGDSAADFRQSIGQEEHGLVFPDEEREPVVTSNGYLQWFVVDEVGRRPAVRCDEVVQKTTCSPSEITVILWAVAWSMCTFSFMLLFLVVDDGLIAAICLV